MPKRLPRARTLKGEPKLAHYDSGGGASGEPPIVLLHQSLARSEDWENIFPRLATRYRAIAYDARGHGKSGRAPDYSLRAFAVLASKGTRAVSERMARVTTATSSAGVAVLPLGGMSKTSGAPSTSTEPVPSAASRMSKQGPSGS